jgi:hypothetical protein
LKYSGETSTCDLQPGFRFHAIEPELLHGDGNLDAACFGEELCAGAVDSDGLNDDALRSG